MNGFYRMPELAAVWNAAADTDFGWIIKLLMLTGQRKEEIRKPSMV